MQRTWFTSIVEFSHLRHCSFSRSMERLSTFTTLKSSARSEEIDVYIPARWNHSSTSCCGLANLPRRFMRYANSSPLSCLTNLIGLCRKEAFEWNLVNSLFIITLMLVKKPFHKIIATINLSQFISKLKFQL